MHGYKRPKKREKKEPASIRYHAIIEGFFTRQFFVQVVGRLGMSRKTILPEGWMTKKSKNANPPT